MCGVGCFFGFGQYQLCGGCQCLYGQYGVCCQVIVVYWYYQGVEWIVVVQQFQCGSVLFGDYVVVGIGMYQCVVCFGLYLCVYCFMGGDGGFVVLQGGFVVDDVGQFGGYCIFGYYYMVGDFVCMGCQCQCGVVVV